MLFLMTIFSTCFWNIALITKEKKKKKWKPLTCESVLESASKVKPVKKSNSKSYKLEAELRSNKKLIGKIKNNKKELTKNDNPGQVYDLWLGNGNMPLIDVLC